MEALLIGNRSDDDGGKVLVAEQGRRQIEIPGGDIHPRTQGDAIGDGPVAAQNRRNLRRSQHQTGLRFILKHIHQIPARHQGRRRVRHMKRRSSLCRCVNGRHGCACHAGCRGHHPEGLAARRRSGRQTLLFGLDGLVI
jgi:hypothetical protein